MSLKSTQISSYAELAEQLLKLKGKRIIAISAIGGGLILGASNQSMQAQAHFEDPIPYPDGIELGPHEVFLRSEFHDVDRDGDRDLLATTYDTAIYYFEDTMVREVLIKTHIINI